MIFADAILLDEQFMALMQPCITIYDLVVISCFLYGDQPG